MGLSASQGRMLLLTARKNDLELRAQQISQRRLLLSQQLESVSNEYEEATSNRVMTITARGADANGSTTTKDYNLSYAALTSGITSRSQDAGTAISSGYGIVANGASESFNSGGFTVTGLYRLVDCDGAIVVSSLDEIPGYKDGDKDEATGEVSFNNSSTITHTATTYEYEQLNDNVTISTMTADEIKSNSGSGGTMYVLNTNGVAIEYEDGGNNIALADVKSNGTTVDNYFYVVKLNEGVDISEVQGKNIAKMTSNKTTYETENNKISSGTITKGSDGKYTLTNAYGAVINRYVLDESLQGGGTSTTEEANYLQDCLRNGLYLIETGTADTDTNEISWKKTSYDALSGVADTYYDADDAAAKAKYDRLQNQIQSQDKRLEMELDNIETQRSAVTTETESVQKVISDNIEKTFKTFNA